MVRLRIIYLLSAWLLSAATLSWAQENADFKEVLPEAASFEPVKSGAEIFYYRALDKDGKLIGAVFKTQSRAISDIETLVGMLKDGTITAIKVLSQKESRGYGSRIATPEFSDRFRNVKDISKVQAITGATVSSRAVIESVRIKAAQVKLALEKGGK